MNYVDMFLFELNLMYANVCVEYVFYLLEIANTKKIPYCLLILIIINCYNSWFEA